MAADLLTAVRWLLSSGWRLLTGITVPGTNIHFAALFVGLFLARLGLRLLFMVLGIIGTSGGVRSRDAAEQRKE